MQDCRDFSQDNPTPPLRTARDLVARHGYHGTSIRNIAEHASLSVPGLYHHHRSKQAMLDALVTNAMTEMLAHTRAADENSDGAPDTRFDNVVECLLRFHMQRRDDAIVASTEIRSMDEPVRRAHVAQRDDQEHMLVDIIEQGVTEGVFRCRHVDDAGRAISSLCVSVATWYRPGGPLSTDQIVERYLEIARRIAGATG